MEQPKVGVLALALVIDPNELALKRHKVKPTSHRKDRITNWPLYAFFGARHVPFFLAFKDYNKVNILKLGTLSNLNIGDRKW